MQPDRVVYIVDDDRDVCQSLEWLFGSVKLDTQAFGSPQDFLEAYTDTRPSCLVTDVRMPLMSGLELQQALAERGCKLPVIVMTGYGDVATAVKAMKFGALDFIEKPFNNQAVLDLVNRALKVDADRRDAAEAVSEIKSRRAQLSLQESRVMDLVVSGNSNKQIANALAISVKTVEVHRARVMQKMRATSLTELVRLDAAL